MRINITALSALLATLTPVLANDIVTLLLPVLDDEPIVAKLLGAQGQMTSYLLNCPPPTTEPCYFPPDGFTLAQGPSSLRWIYSSAGFTGLQDCDILSTTGVSCVATMIDGNTTQVNHGALTTDSLPYHRVTITATETQGGVTTTATASATTKGAPSFSSATATATAASAGTNTTGGTGSVAATTHTTSQNAAMAWATASPMQWIAGGAAIGAVLVLV